MAKIVLSWENDSNIHSHQKIYKSLSAFDSNTLPSDVVTIGRDVRVYEDTDVVEGFTYYYAVATVDWNGAEYLSDVLEVEAVESGGGPTPTLPTVIGEASGGGFYAGDIESDGQWYKLIVADKAADITGTNSRWKTTNTDTPGTDHLVDGVSNTNAMVAAGIELHPAAAHCIGHLGGGNADWYMPARDELNVIYQNLGFNRPNCPPDFQAGGPQAFSNASYWSSTQDSSSTSWRQSFSSGSQFRSSKSGTSYRVRPVRRIAFTPD